MKIFAKVAALLSGFGIVALGFASFAAASSYPVGGQNYFLSGAGVTSSQTTIPLTSFKTPDGRAITMSMFGDIGYGTLEPQSPSKVEFVTFTGISQNPSGTAVLTGVTRGIDFVYPYAASTTLRESHSGGSTFIITNTPSFYYDQFTMNNNNNLFTWPAASTSPASRGYVDYVAFNGAAVINADTLNKGIVQIATQLQAASSTALGSSGATIVIPASTATSSYNAATAPLRAVVTQNSGLIDPRFVFNGVTLTFPATQGAASTTLTNNGSGALTWQAYSNLLNGSTTAMSLGAGTATASTTVYSASIPASALSLRNATRITLPLDFAITASSQLVLEAAYGTASTTITYSNTSSATATRKGMVTFLLKEGGTTASQAASLQLQSSLNVNGFLATTTTAILNTTSAQDSTAAKNLLITVKTGNAGDTVTTYFSTTEFLRE